MRLSGARLTQWLWPTSRLGEAVDLLARVGGVRQEHTLPVPDTFRRADAVPQPEQIEGWLEGAADCLGLQLRRRELLQRELSAALGDLAPALIQVGNGPDTAPGVLLLLEARRERLLIAKPDGQRLWLERETLVKELTATLEGTLRERAEGALEGLLSGRRRQRAVGAIVEGQLGPLLLVRAWQFRLPIGSSFWRHVAASRLPRRLALYLLMHFSQYALMLLSWWLIGKAALQGRVESSWLQAWFLLALTQVPLGMVALRARGVFAIGLGGLLKTRLMDGAFAVDPDTTRDQGAGQLLGRVIESEAIERLALTAGLTGVVALVELLIAGIVLAMGPGGLLRVGLFVGWLLLSGWSGWSFYRSRLQWARTRREMTNDLVERMVGHRTRLAQQLPWQWHSGEDALLAKYIERSAHLDRRAVRLTTVLSRGWLAVGLASLLPIIVLSPEDPIAVAVALGGVLLASRALGSLVGGMDALGAALVAWQQVRDLFRRARRDTSRPSAEALVWLGRESAPPPMPAAVSKAGYPVTGRDGAGAVREVTHPVTGLMRSASDAAPGRVLLEAQDVVFRYRPEREPALNGCGVRIHHGDRVLIQGPSGGGKSTLAMVLAGIRHPEHGLVLLEGLDARTLGERVWRRRIVAAPQYHENHIFTGTMAFNLLMGRRWPATPQDLEEAALVCRELGLGDLLDRMPGGLQQVVGNTGWRLSHGEKSRVFIARSLLQHADMMLLDESFAALDPASMNRALRCVLKRAPTLVVVAHP